VAICLALHLRSGHRPDVQSGFAQSLAQEDSNRGNLDGESIRFDLGWGLQQNLLTLLVMRVILELQIIIGEPLDCPYCREMLYIGSQRNPGKQETSP
jgi:hypothetical protein